MLNRDRFYLGGISINILDFKETLDFICSRIEQKIPTQHLAVNAGKIIGLQKDFQLYQSALSADIVSADGQSIVWASKVLGKSLPERVAGIDLMESLIEIAYKKGYSCFFFGAKDDVLGTVIEHYSRLYSPSIIAGFRNGYYEDGEDEEIAKMISESEADILFVAITSPKKEIFLSKYRNIVKTPFVMGVGGSFDVVAGKTNRAPIWMQKHGLEWFYRFIQEPKRMWKRYLVGNSKFILLVLKQKLGLYKDPWAQYKT